MFNILNLFCLNIMLKEYVKKKAVSNFSSWLFNLERQDKGDAFTSFDFFGTESMFFSFLWSFWPMQNLLLFNSEKQIWIWNLLLVQRFLNQAAIQTTEL